MPDMLRARLAFDLVGHASSPDRAPAGIAPASVPIQQEASPSPEAIAAAAPRHDERTRLVASVTAADPT